MVNQFSPRLTKNVTSDQNFKDLETLSVQIIRGRLLQNVLVEGVQLDTTVSTVSHTLDRRPQGWFIIRKNANADVWEPSDSASPTKVINLQASSPVTVDIIFF